MGDVPRASARSSAAPAVTPRLPLMNSLNGLHLRAEMPTGTRDQDHDSGADYGPCSRRHYHGHPAHFVRSMTQQRRSFFSRPRSLVVPASDDSSVGECHRFAMRRGPATAAVGGRPAPARTPAPLPHRSGAGEAPGLRSSRPPLDARSRARWPREAAGSGRRACGQPGIRCCRSGLRWCSCCGWRSGGSSVGCSRSRRATRARRGTVRPPGRVEPPAPKDGPAQVPGSRHTSQTRCGAFCCASTGEPGTMRGAKPSVGTVWNRAPRHRKKYVHSPAAASDRRPPTTSRQPPNALQPRPPPGAGRSTGYMAGGVCAAPRS